MTRSELVEKGIELFNHAVAMTKDENAIYFGNEEMREMNQFGLELFLAEQKRAAGCDVCNGDGSLDAGIYLLKNKKGEFVLEHRCGQPYNGCGEEETEAVYYCPRCGKRLTDGESV